MSRDGQALWDRLGVAGLVDGEPPPTGDISPWYVRAMLGIAGWIAAAFLLGFLGAAFSAIFRHSGLAAIVGVFVCGCAAVLIRSLPHNTFAASFGIAASFAGQAMVGSALIRTGASATWTLLAAFQILLLLAIPNPTHRIWSAFAAVTCAGIALRVDGLGAVAPALFALVAVWLWVHEFVQARRASLTGPMAYGLTLSALVMQGTLLPEAARWAAEMRYARTAAELVPASIPPLLDGAVLLVAAWWLLRREGVRPGSRVGVAALAGAIALAAATWHAPGVAVAVLFLVLGFANGNRVLLGIGVVAMLGYLSHYYYQLQVTLLFKSAVLAGTGVALLAAKLALSAWLPRTGAGDA